MISGTKGRFRETRLGVQFDRLLGSERIVKTPHMRMINGRWRVRVVVPSALVPIIGKANLTRIIGSRDKQRDKKEAAQFVAKFLARIEDAKRQLEGEPKRWWMEYNYSPWNSFGSSRLRRGKPSPNMIPVIHDGQIEC